MTFWMIVILVVIIAIAIAGTWLSVDALKRYRDHMRRLSPENEIKIPASPLQQRAVATLIITLTASLLIAAMFIGEDMDGFLKNDTLRLRFTGILIFTMLLNLAMRFTLLPGGFQRGPALDERDKQILMGAGTWQTSLLLILLMVWTVALTETYWDQQAIPIDAPYLMFWTAFLVYFIGWSLGILAGTWRMNRDGE